MESCEYCTKYTKCEEPTCTAEAVVYCKGHDMCFCYPCYVKKHERMPSFVRNHHVDYLERGKKLCSAVQCPEHKKPVDIFCDDCKKYVCSDCLVANDAKHKDHRHTDSKKLIEDARKANEDSVTRCYEEVVELKRTITAFNSEIDASRARSRAEIQKITDTFAAAQQALRDRQAELIRAVEEKNKSYEKLLTDKINDLSRRLEETKRHAFHGQRAIINCNENNLEATLSHFKAVRTEMEAAAFDALKQNGDERQTKQQTYTFAGSGLTEYIKGFGSVDETKSDIRHSGFAVDNDEIARKCAEEFRAAIEKLPCPELPPRGLSSISMPGPLAAQPSQQVPPKLPSPSQQPLNEVPLPAQQVTPKLPPPSQQPLNEVPLPAQQVTPKLPLPLQQTPQEVPLPTQQTSQEVPLSAQEVPKQDLQSKPTSVPPAPAPAVVQITHIDPPKVVSSRGLDGSIELTWTVDPKIAGLDYKVGIYVGSAFMNDVPNRSTSYKLDKALPKGTKVSVATAYNNVGSDYGQVIV